MAQKELRDPLVLLVAAGRTPGQIRLAIAQRHGRRQRGARAFSGRERGRMAFLEPEHLGAAAEAEAELRNDGRGLQPAAGRRRGDHVAVAIDDVEMHGVTAYLAETADRRLARAHRADRLAVTLGAAQLDDGAKTLDRAGTKFERRRLRDQL